MKKRFALLIASLGIHQAAVAETQEAAFLRTYLETCVTYISNHSELIKKLPATAELSAEDTKGFSAGMTGRAWQIPAVEGFFVLFLAQDKALCFLHGLYMQGQEVQRYFDDFAAKPREKKMQSEKREDRILRMENGMKSHDLSYVWSIPNHSRKLAFSLTYPLGSDSWPLLLSAAVIRE